MKILALILAFSGLVLIPAAPAQAQAAEYISIKPPFVVNLGTVSGPRLSYLKTEVALRTNSKSAAETVKYHLPYLRNEIVLLLSRQDLASVSTNEGKEKLRGEALEKVQTILQQEEGAPLVTDLLFSTFVVQR